jgi:hypothetical protein
MADIIITGSVSGIPTPSDLTVTVGGVSYAPTFSSGQWSVTIPEATLDALAVPIDVTARAENAAGVTQANRPLDRS